MARYRKIDPRIWNDEKFRSLSHEAQRAFFFVLTHPSMTGLGAFRISRAGMAEELGLDPKGFAIPFQELLEKGLVKYDEKAFLIYAPNFLKYNQPENPNVIKGWAMALDLLPECALKDEVLRRAESCAAKTDAGLKAFRTAFGELPKGLAKGLGEPFPKGMPKQEQEQEQEQNIKESEEKTPSGSPKRPSASIVIPPSAGSAHAGIFDIDLPSEDPDRIAESEKKTTSAPKAAATRKRPAARCPFGPDEAIPAAYLEIAQKAGIGNPQSVFAGFVNYCLAKDVRYCDWLAAFRNWCANELKYHPNQQPPRGRQHAPADYSDWLS